jgi:hypothetical protein
LGNDGGGGSGGDSRAAMFQLLLSFVIVCRQSPKFEEKTPAILRGPFSSNFKLQTSNFKLLYSPLHPSTGSDPIF